MPAFADASALVKRYVDEPGHEVVDPGLVLVVSALSRVEVTSAIRRKERLGELTPDLSSLLCTVVDADFEQRRPDAAVSLSVTSEVLRDAAQLTGRHGLRTGDAIQLASALQAREQVPACDSLVCFDARLRVAAADEGFRLVPPTLT